MDWLSTAVIAEVFIWVLLFFLSMGIARVINLVVEEIPASLYKTMREECLDFLGLSDTDTTAIKEQKPLERLSHQCHHCDYRFKWIERLPFIGFMFHRATCPSCRKQRYFRPFIIDFIVLIFSLTMIACLGFHLKTLLLLVLGYLFLVIAVIDEEQHIIPDIVVLPLLWIGLVANSFNLFVPATIAILGAAIGYLVLWIFNKASLLSKGTESFALGDAKLLACIGAWFGYQLLPLTIFFTILILWIIFFFRRKSDKVTAPAMPVSMSMISAMFIALLTNEMVVNFIKVWFMR